MSTPRQLMAQPSSASSPLWKTREAKSVKSGAHHAIYWVKQGPSTTKDKFGNTIPGATSYVPAAKYTGEWQGDAKSGYGTYVCGSGNKYEGEWQDGKRHGKGTLWVKRKGSSKLIKQYTGDWVDDKRQGLGVFYYEDGGKYEGFWAKNCRDGKGRMTYADGSVYEGHWSDNERSGMGILTMPNGNRYEGYWMHDKKEGPGRFFYKSTHKVYEAEWLDDMPKCGTYHDVAESAFDKPPEAFELPELELENPESVLNETIMQLREARLEAAHGATVFSLPSDTHKRIQEEFHAIDTRRRGVIRCVDLVRILESVEEDDHDGYEDRVSALLSELGASYDTLITLPECMDIMALLLEPVDEKEESNST
ncbi:hypothetical protein LEN26_012786 [Aphanomyces euteiches]|nr:hypothetical protein LEN26_012786 [Aphanomyces euteiches]